MNGEWFLAEDIKKLRADLVNLETRVIEGEGIRMRQSQAILKLSKLVARLSGVSQEDIDAIMSQIPPGI